MWRRVLFNDNQQHPLGCRQKSKDQASLWRDRGRLCANALKDSSGALCTMRTFTSMYTHTHTYVYILSLYTVTRHLALRVTIWPTESTVSLYRVEYISRARFSIFVIKKLKIKKKKGGREGEEIGALDGRKASEKLIARCTLDRFSGGEVFSDIRYFFPPLLHDMIFLLQKTEMMKGKSYPARYNFLFRHPRSTSCRIFRFERIPPVFFGLFFIFLFFFLSLSKRLEYFSTFFPRYFSFPLFLYREFFPPPAGSRKRAGVKRRTRN